MIMIEDVLDSYSSTNGLSANMGRELNEKIEDLEEKVSNLENSNPSSGSACQLVIW